MIEYKRLYIPSNLSKVFCVDILNSCKIHARFYSEEVPHDDGIHPYIVVNSLFYDEARVILETCGIVEARQHLVKED